MAYKSKEVAAETSDRELGFVTDHGARAAELTVATLERTGLFPQEAEGRPGWTKLPSSVLYEMAAVIQLKLWESSGINKFTPDELPTHDEAIEQFTTRCRENYGSFREANSAPLARQVFAFWAQNFAWNAPQDLGAEVLVGTIDEDNLVEAMAQLLWNCRHTFKSTD